MVVHVRTHWALNGRRLPHLFHPYPVLIQPCGSRVLPSLIHMQKAVTEEESCMCVRMFSGHLPPQVISGCVFLFDLIIYIYISIYEYNGEILAHTHAHGQLETEYVSVPGITTEK